MATSTITFRTDDQLKKEASQLFDSLGMNLSVALNMFMRQAVEKQAFPCALELGISADCSATYPIGFFELAGSGNDLGLDEEPADLPWDSEDIEL